MTETTLPKGRTSLVGLGKWLARVASTREAANLSASKCRIVGDAIADCKKRTPAQLCLAYAAMCAATVFVALSEGATITFAYPDGKSYVFRCEK